MRTVLFDIDGTLMFFRGVGKAALQRAMEEVWQMPEALKGVSFAGGTDNAIALEIGGNRPREALFARYLEHLTAGLATFPDRQPLAGAVELIDRLEREGVRLALLTGNLREGARLKLETIDLWHRFDHSRSAFGDEGDSRLEVAETARRRCGDVPLVVIGDSMADASAGRHIGARVLLTATGPQERALLDTSDADLVVDDLAEVGPLVEWILER